MHLVQKAMETAASDSGQDPPVILFFRYRFFVLLLWMFARLHITAPLQKKCPRGVIPSPWSFGFSTDRFASFFLRISTFFGCKCSLKGGDETAASYAVLILSNKLPQLTGSPTHKVGTSSVNVGDQVHIRVNWVIPRHSHCSFSPPCWEAISVSVSFVSFRMSRATSFEDPVEPKFDSSHWLAKGSITLCFLEKCEGAIRVDIKLSQASYRDHLSM